MEPLGQLLSSDSRETLQFFFAELKDATAGERVADPAVLYNASVLAHFASASTTTGLGMPTPVSLMDVFDRFVLHATPQDPETLEMAASQCLLLTGFFADQQRVRYNLEWYGRLGASFYRVAAATSRQPEHQKMMRQMSGQFDFWRLVYQKLSRELRTTPYRLL